MPSTVRNCLVLPTRPSTPPLLVLNFRAFAASRAAPANAASSTNRNSSKALSAFAMCFRVLSDGRDVWCSLAKNLPRSHKNTNTAATAPAMEARGNDSALTLVVPVASVKVTFEVVSSLNGAGGGGAMPCPGGGGSNTALVTNPAPAALYAYPSGGPLIGAPKSSSNKSPVVSSK